MALQTSSQARQPCNGPLKNSPSPCSPSQGATAICSLLPHAPKLSRSMLGLLGNLAEPVRPGGQSQQHCIPASASEMASGRADGRRQAPG